jgi:hypothetical protein
MEGFVPHYIEIPVIPQTKRDFRIAKIQAIPEDGEGPTWEEEMMIIDDMSKEIYTFYQNPTTKQREYVRLPDARPEDRIFISIETVADWYCQSINRSYYSVCNPKKSYFVPPLLQSMVKRCFKIKNADLNDDNKDEVYFKDSTINMSNKVTREAEIKKWSTSHIPPDLKRMKPK